MGTYSYEEWNDLFGGPPEPGEAYPSLEQIDNLRKAQKEHGPHHLGASSETPAGTRRVPSQGTVPAGNSLKRFQRAGMSCDNCGAAEDQSCQPWCRGEQIS